MSIMVRSPGAADATIGMALAMTAQVAMSPLMPPGMMRS